MKTNRIPHLIRRLLLSYLIAVTAVYLSLPAEWQVMDKITPTEVLSPSVILLITLGVILLLSLLARFRYAVVAERFLLPPVFAVLATAVLLKNPFSLPFLLLCLLIEAILTVYALCGQNGTESRNVTAPHATKSEIVGLSIMASGFIAVIGLWGGCRVVGLSTPTYDFGIFSQMFHAMKTSGLPMTTLERDGLLSHFRVHVSPIYYLMLPLYALFPHPAALQVQQAFVLASSVIPLWLIGKQHGLEGRIRLLLCAALLLYPALAGGTAYDLHENCFLTPLILWLFLAIDRRRTLPSLLCGILILAVKEDAAVYVAVIALWLILHALLHCDRRGGIMGLVLLVISLGYFLLVTDYLATVGDGVMAGRYQNLMPSDNGSLLSVVVLVITNPAKAFWECVDPEKLRYIGLTLVPLLGLPLLTRRYERYLLLIPYLLVNLMPDYVYQHDIFFQYSFGSLACLFYLTAVNLADLRPRFRLRTLVTITASCALLFGMNVLPRALDYTARAWIGREENTQIKELLDTIPPNASVTAGTFMTTYLSSRDVLYDLGYASRAHLLGSQYVVIDLKHEGDFAQYATNGKNGYARLLALLHQNGYEIYGTLENRLIVFEKSHQ